MRQTHHLRLEFIFDRQLLLMQRTESIDFLLVLSSDLDVFAFC